jgi:hypothetical protein
MIGVSKADFEHRLRQRRGKAGGPGIDQPSKNRQGRFSKHSVILSTGSKSAKHHHDRRGKNQRRRGFPRRSLNGPL